MSRDEQSAAHEAIGADFTVTFDQFFMKLFVPQMKVHGTKQTLYLCCSSHFCVSLLVRSGVCAIRAFEDESKARLGVVECAKHELLQPFNVLHEKEGEALVPQSYNFTFICKTFNQA